MAVATIRPNSTGANAWETGDHTDLDEEVVQPNDGNQGEDVVAAGEITGDDNAVIELGFPNTINDVDEVTNITVWTNGFVIGGDTPEVMITGEAYVECSIPETNYGWTSDSFNVSWNQAELDALQVSYRADVPDKEDFNNLDVCYVVVTYTPTAPAGYQHKFLGIAPNKIGKVCGIPTANVGKIKGV